MTLHQQEKLIITLAQMVMAKQRTSEIVQSALSLLCEGFSFDYALVYEMDGNDSLMLTEWYGIQAPKKSFKSDAYFQLAAMAKKESTVYCHDQTDPLQSEWLSLFNAASLAAISSENNEGYIHNLIVLANHSEKETLEKTSWENLKTALSILSDKLAVRVFQNRIRNAQTALENILDNTGIDIYVNDFQNHDILYVNESMAKPYGGKKEFMGRKCWQVLFPGQTGPCTFCPQKMLIDDEGKPSKVYTWDYQRAFDGSWFRVFSAAFRWVDGRLAHVVSSADITDNKRNEELVRYMANYDSLTNLPNRRKLVADCEERIQASGKIAFLLFFDIDNFKNINDSLGHDAGDEFLVKLGAFFSGIPMLKDSIYRNGGDEFVALMKEDITAQNVQDLSRFIQMRFEKPWLLEKGSVMSGISIGVSEYPKDGRTAEKLLHKADQAMYHVKKNGGAGICFAEDQE